MEVSSAPRPGQAGPLALLCEGVLEWRCLCRPAGQPCLSRRRGFAMGFAGPRARPAAPVPALGPAGRQYVRQAPFNEGLLTPRARYFARVPSLRVGWR